MQIELVCEIPPEGELDLETTLITYLDIASRFLPSSLKRHCSNRSYLNENSDYINSLLLHKILDSFEVYK